MRCVTIGVVCRPFICLNDVSDILGLRDNDVVAFEGTSVSFINEISTDAEQSVKVQGASIHVKPLAGRQVSDYTQSSFLVDLQTNFSQKHVLGCVTSLRKLFALNGSQRSQFAQIRIDDVRIPCP